MTSRNTRLIDDMGTLARSLDNRAAAYRLAGDGLLAQCSKVAARHIREAIAELETLARLESEATRHA